MGRGTQATDFIHDEAITDRLLLGLATNLPASWAKDSGVAQYALQRLEFGNLYDYWLAEDETVWTETPAIYVRPLREEPDALGLGGHEATDHLFRVVHVFQRKAGANSASSLNPTRDRVQRAKVISAALYLDLAGDPSRNLGDASGDALVLDAETPNRAKVFDVVPGPVAYEGSGDDFDLPNSKDLFAVTLDLTVKTTSLGGAPNAGP